VEALKRLDGPTRGLDRHAKRVEVAEALAGGLHGAYFPFRISTISAAIAYACNMITEREPLFVMSKLFMCAISTGNSLSAKRAMAEQRGQKLVFTSSGDNKRG